MKFRLLLLGVFFTLRVLAQGTTDEKDLSVDQCLKAAQEKKEAGDVKEATRYLNLAAITQWENKDYSDAIKYFNESIALNTTINNFSGIAKLNSNLGMIYSDMADYNQSLIFFQKALQYRDKSGEKSEKISTRINIAVVLNNLKRYDDAAKTLEEALSLATEMNDGSQMKSCYGMLSETYQKAGNQERALHYFNLYKTFHEMIQRNKINEAHKETETAKLQALNLELAKKELEIATMRVNRELKITENDLQRESGKVRDLVEKQTKLELALSVVEGQKTMEEMKLEEAKVSNERQEVWLWVIITGAATLIVFVLFMYRNYRFKKYANRQLSEQNEEIRALNENLEIQVQKRTAELRKTLSNLEKRNKDLDQFSQIISHNLRGPVASILGLNQVINKSNPADPLNLEVFSQLQNSTRNLDDVVKDLSKILEVRDGHGIATERVQLKDVCTRVCALLGNEISESDTGVKTELGELPVVETFRPYIESVLFNLMSNAIKYRSPHRTPKIEIHSARRSERIMITVKDNGEGIDEKDFDNIFLPYKRLNTKVPGRGLGLYMARTQTEAMGGTLLVTSEKHEGSVFTIYLPDNS